MFNNKYIPWVEKYRPNNLSDIVLDKYNRLILNNIVENDHFPNLLFYGPPGTGKTTTIINLIKNYQEKMNQKHKGLMIHLNASDERGIDIIRNQISTFVNSSFLFNRGMKFVILDEVDYMTKNAQQALKYLLQNYSKNNVRYCLICNYVSRIDESLQNEFIRLRFNRLPTEDITHFLNKVLISEGISINTDLINSIQNVYNSDIRSMINHIQLNQTVLHENKIITSEIWNILTNHLRDDNLKNNYKFIQQISIEYGIEYRTLIKQYLNYIIKKTNITSDLLDFIENLLHNSDIPTEYYVKYTILRLSKYLRGST